MEKFKYITNISENVAEIRIYKRIGGPDGVNGSDFANEIAYLQDVSNQINVRINSGGGSVLDAMAIQAAIMNSTVPVDTYIDGVAASAAGTIAVSGRKCFIADNALFMAHNTVDESKNQANKKILDVFNESVATHLANRTGKTPEEIREIMNKETWMNAKECLANGIADEIISTKKKLKTPKVKNAFELEKIYNEFLIEKIDMKNINNELALSLDNSDESAIINAVKVIKTERDALKLENEKLKKAENDRIEAEKTALTNDVNAYANKLVADKKIKEEEKAQLIANASKDRASFEWVKNIYDTKVSNVVPAKKAFDPSKVTNDKGTPEDRTNWTYMNWVDKDPAGLEKMMNEHPEQFQELQSK